MILLREGSQGTPHEHYEELPCSPSWPSSQFLFFPSQGREVARWFFGSGMAERPLISWLRTELLKGGSCFVDIGAHVGTYTIACAPRTVRTYAFECSPRTFCYLAANVALHDLCDRVTLFNCALGDQTSKVDYIQRSGDGGGNGIKELSANDVAFSRQSVDVKRLDDLSLDYPAGIGVVKIDVEGAEVEVIRGSRETLRKNGYPPLVFESWGHWKTDVDTVGLRSELFSEISSLGYAIHELRAFHFDTFLAVHPSDPSRRNEIELLLERAHFSSGL